MFALYDTVRAQVHIDEVWTAGEEAREHEPEVARREQGVWRLYGYQQ